MHAGGNGIEGSIGMWIVGLVEQPENMLNENCLETARKLKCVPV